MVIVIEHIKVGRKEEVVCCKLNLVLFEAIYRELYFQPLVLLGYFTKIIFLC